MVNVLKNTGELEEFDREKLRDSLLKASASLVATNDVIEKVESRLKDGMTTSEIYRIAFALLNKQEKRTAYKYSIKRSLLDLGPTGFPFEKFIGEIFKKKGFNVTTGVRLLGKCVDHEIDVVAYNKNELALVEVKFHNSLSIKTDTKVALYVKARFDDLKENAVNLEEGLSMKPTRGILLTNTKFTRNSEKYAKCVGLGMISWDYPAKGNLYDMINDTGLHPITVIPSLTTAQKKVMLDLGYITCNQIVSNPDILSEIGVKGAKAKKVAMDASLVCGN